MKVRVRIHEWPSGPRMTRIIKWFCCIDKTIFLSYTKGRFCNQDPKGVTMVKRLSHEIVALVLRVRFRLNTDFPVEVVKIWSQIEIVENVLSK